MAIKSTSNRRPAEIVKCPKCKWTGSARGLHAHGRLAHNTKYNDTRSVNVNRYAVKGKTIGSISNTKSKLPNDYQMSSTEALLVALSPILLPVIEKIFNSFIDSVKQPQRAVNKVQSKGPKVISGNALR